MSTDPLQKTAGAPPVGSSALVRRLVFACGGTYEVKEDPPRTKAGRLKGILTHAATIGVVVKGPLLPTGHVAPCLWGCPTPGRHRKEERAWVGEKALQPEGEPVLCVICRPMHILPNEKGQP